MLTTPTLQTLYIAIFTTLLQKYDKKQQDLSLAVHSDF